MRSIICRLSFTLLGSWVISSCLTPTLRHPASSEASLSGSDGGVLFTSDFVTEVAKAKISHSPTLTELPDHRIMVCWYEGSSEGDDDVEIYCRTKAKGAEKWEPRTIAVARDEKTEGHIINNKTLGNPVLYTDDDGTVYLFYTIRTFGGWAVADVGFKFSIDSGASWSAGKILENRSERRISGKLSRALPLRLGPGKILLPLYYEGFSKAGYTCELLLAHGIVTKSHCLDIPGKGHLQPTLVEKKGKVLAYLRSVNPEKEIEMAEMDLVQGSSKNSAWVKQANLNLPNPDSSVAAIKSEDGAILLVYNEENGRKVLSLARSEDGRSFRKLFSFEKDLAEPVIGFSYPSLLRSSDGTYHLVFTYQGRSAIRHVHFNQAWINSLIPPESR